MKEVDAAVDALEKGVLLVLACIADWNPLCRKVVPLLESVRANPLQRRHSQHWERCVWCSVLQQSLFLTHLRIASRTTSKGSGVSSCAVQINQHIQSVHDPPLNNNANDSPKHATWTPPKIPGKVKVMTVDMSESQLLQNRFNFRCCPMFLCFWDHKLVHASNTMRYTDEFYKQVRASPRLRSASSQKGLIETERGWMGIVIGMND